MKNTLAKAVVLYGLLFWGVVPVIGAEPLFHRGDVNQDGRMDLSDAVAVLRHLFIPSQDAPCEKAADINDDGLVQISDAVYALQYMFAGGPPPPPPFGGCGEDPTADTLSCDTTPCGLDPPTVTIAEYCSDDPLVELSWEVINLGTATASLTWELEGTFQSGTLQVPPLDSTVLSTARVPGVNELVLSWQGEEVARLAQVRVIISEFMASNATSYADEDGDSSDWIEIQLLNSACLPDINLAGWYLTDDPLNRTKWQFPSVTLEAGGYLLVFASEKDRAEAGQELHTNFRLATEGEYLALVAADGETVVDEFSPTFPEQLTDVSYGLAQQTTTFIQAGDQVRYHVPAASDAGLGNAWADPDYPASGWSTGTIGLGFSGITTQGLEVTCIKCTVAINDLNTAQSVLNDPSRQSWTVTETAPFLDYFNTGGSGNYANDYAFPGMDFSDQDDFLVYVTGSVLIPDTGPWSFGVNSDDGFSLELKKGAKTFSMEYASPRAPADTIEIFTITEAGPYELELLFYERGGGAEFELFAAQGNHPSFTYDHFRLVGDTANGGLGLLGFAADIGTDVSGVMQGTNASLWTRIDFTVDDADALGGLVLRMKYEDGFTAFLNGQEVASRNAPATLQWNSPALSDRPVEEIPLVEEINLAGALPLLVDGGNVLAIHGLNNASSDGDFLMLPELIGASSQTQMQYMSMPTPGAFNVAGAVNFVKSVGFSAERGFYDDPFVLTLSTPTPGAQIRYTFNGSTPTSTTGSVYTGPITINGTTVIRAAAFRSNYLDSKTTTRTYIFVSDVIQQSPNGQLPGPGWPTSGSVNGHTMDYGMDPDIVNDPRWGPLLEDALLDISTISLVTDLENLFSPSTGIYVNPRNDGRAWERPTSIELLHPDGREGFGVDGGLRIRGAVSRSSGNPKHSLRLFFRSVYGPGKLQYALFGGEGADEFDKVDLRTSQNYAWAFTGDSKNVLIREVYSRDVQGDMHQPYAKSRYYHIYINGQYWGLYMTHERTDADFAETYLHGDDSQYDTIKNDSSGSRALHATDGTMDAYQRLYDAAVAGFSTNQAYFAVQGLRPDGTPDPSGERLVDLDNLMDYMICTYFTGDFDAPVSWFIHVSNNVFGIYNHVNPKGFTWYRHDAEHSMGVRGGSNANWVIVSPEARSIGQQWNHFNPSWLHLRMHNHPEYAVEFADRVNMYLSNGGILSAQPSIDRWLARANQIDLAIIAESARWGDAKTNPPRTKDHWLDQVTWTVNSFIPPRAQTVINQMRTVDLFPEPAIVSFNKHGGEVAPGFELLMSQSNGTPGTIYYTTDGSDPRLWGGAINPSAAIFEDDTTGVTLISRQSVWQYKDDGSNQGTAWRGMGFNDSSWDQGPAELGYGDGGEATEVGYGPDPDNKYQTTYFRHTFTVTDAADIVELTLGIMRDDGALVYLNDVEATPRINMPTGTIDYQTYAAGTVSGGDESTFYTYDIDPELLVEGTNVMAVEIHQVNAGSSDISFDLELYGLVAGTSSPPIVLSETTTVKARVRGTSAWGALTKARFWVGVEGLVINEIMASNHVTLEDPDEPGEHPDWIEIYNGTAGLIDLGGMFLSDEMHDLTKWSFAPGMSIASGGYLIIYLDDDGTQGNVHTNYQLSRLGESIALVDVDGTTIIDKLVFDTQRDDVSYGRFPDGSATWGFHQAATPEAANQPHTP